MTFLIALITIGGTARADGERANRLSVDLVIDREIAPTNDYNWILLGMSYSGRIGDRLWLTASVDTDLLKFVVAPIIPIYKDNVPQYQIQGWLGPTLQLLGNDDGGLLGLARLGFLYQSTVATTAPFGAAKAGLAMFLALPGGAYFKLEGGTWRDWARWVSYCSLTLEARV
jgi:hypothetical protein